MHLVIKMKTKNITIRDDQESFIVEEHICLSRLVQEILDEKMTHHKLVIERNRKIDEMVSGITKNDSIDEIIKRARSIDIFKKEPI